jgi:MoxR-like ATPase
VSEEYRDRIPEPQYYYYGKETWEMALAVLLAGRNLLLAGPKATGKNVLCENLAAAFGQPVWNVSFHINMDASYLIGTDTFDGTRVTFRPGPIYLCADRGGFGVLDEINMAKNESLAVLHSALDFRRAIDVPGYDLIRVKPQTRFIGTMNYGYAGTRELNEALSSRFAILSVPEISEPDLDRLIKRSFPDISPKICTQFVKLFVELMRKTEKAEISDRALDLRGLLDALSLIREGLTAGQALRMCIVDKTFDAYEQSLIMDVVKARIPAELDRTIAFG